MIIACSVDRNYAMPLAVALYSLLLNTNIKSIITIYILDGGIDVDQRDRILKCVHNTDVTVNLVWREVETSNWQPCGSRTWMTGVVFARLLLPEVLPRYISKVIYLDADLIVRGDLYELWKLDITNYSVAAVRDQAIGMVSSIWGIANYHELGLAPNTPYFNSGVMVINLDKWRRLEVARLAFEYIDTNRDIMRLNDQEALNSILHDNWLEIDPKWNQHPRVFTFNAWANSAHKHRYRNGIEQLVLDPYIIHYAARPKPWHHESLHPYQYVWIHYLKRSGWFNRFEWNMWWANLLCNTIESSLRLLYYRIKKISDRNKVLLKKPRSSP